MDFCWRTLCVTAVIISAGCAAPRALRREVVMQSGTLSEIQQQQVLDNLAKFVRKPYALPDFAWPREGSTAVNDDCQGMGTLEWNFTRFTGATLGGNARRTKNHGWTLTPINDPRKLELMRCAYQKAVAECGYARISTCCPDCERRMNSFYMGEPLPKLSEKVADDSVSSTGDMNCELPRDSAASNCGTLNGENRRIDPCSACRQNPGIVTYDCITPGRCRWFAFGPKAAVPKHLRCKLVGHHCGTYVWILPEGEDEFTKLALAILDYATNDPVQKRQKIVEVEYTINDRGQVVGLKSLKETFDADVDDPLEWLGPPKEVRKFTRDPQGVSPNFLAPTNPTYPQTPTRHYTPGILQLRQQLETLAPLPE